MHAKFYIAGPAWRVCSRGRWIAGAGRAVSFSRILEGSPPRRPGPAQRRASPRIRRPGFQSASPNCRSRVAPASCRQVAAASPFDKLGTPSLSRGSRITRKLVGWKPMPSGMPARCRRYVRAAAIIVQPAYSRSFASFAVSLCI